MPSKAAMLGRAEDTLTRTYMRSGETPLPSAAPGITSVQSRAVLESTDSETTQTASHGLTATETEVFLNREKQTRDDS